jgi:hypothetical protein
MSIPTRLSSYLEQRGVRYDVCAHQRSRTSAQTARTANVLPRELAKSVIVEDDAGCVMAVVPADRKVRLGELSRMRWSASGRFVGAVPALSHRPRARVERQCLAPWPVREQTQASLGRRRALIRPACVTRGIRHGHPHVSVQ